MFEKLIGLEPLDASTFTFTPGGPGAGTILIEHTDNFSIARVLAVTNVTRGVVIYVANGGSTGLGGVWSAVDGAGGTLTLNFDTSGHSGTDALKIAFLPVDYTVATLNQIITALGAVTITNTSFGVTGSLPDFANPQHVVIDSLPAQRVETLWTDDTGSYFVRVDTGGTISWFDISGAASSPPGAGARPAAGNTMTVDRTSYQAIAAGTGYSIGDFLDHVVTVDPATGVVLAHFWLNVTTEATLPGAPSSANITPLSPLPSGASTAANQLAANASLSSLDGKSPALVSGRVPVAVGGSLPDFANPQHVVIDSLPAQRVETLWTDDTGSYFVRVDTGGTISWFNISGTASSPPGAGARPAAGNSIIVDRASYQATANGTGYSIGNFLDHVVTTDPATGVVLAHFWLNVTTEATLPGAPSSSDITPLSPLPSGASTAANQVAANTSLSSLDGKFPALVSGRVPVQSYLRGAAGADASANQPVLPNVGANFAASGPYASYVLVKTVAANADRINIEVGNMTGTQIAIVRDDGTAASGAAPVNASVFALAGGAGTGQQGGGWTSSTFRGRIQVYAPAALSGSAFINVMTE